jgi:zinc transporter ZupT
VTAPIAIELATVSAAIGAASAALGVSSIAGAPRRIIPFGGGLLMGIAVFGVLPELAANWRWSGAAALLVAGFALLWLLNRYVYTVCPSCSPAHDHAHCATALHGFALPLLIAAGIHAFLDGIGIGAAQQSANLGTLVVLGVVLHKVPEGVALGGILRAAMKRPAAAFAWCAAAQAMTIAGSLLESVITTRFGTAWVMYGLALAGGSFLFLGFHAVHGEWQRRGAPAFMPALTGAAGAAMLQHGLRVLLR